MAFQMLTLDGGGIRGVFSAAVLAAIEEDLDVNIRDHFDLISGTSTGGIIAIALGLGIPPRGILDFYVSEGPKIFRDPFALRKAWHWVHAKHDPRQLEESLRAVFGDSLFGESTKRLVVPSYNIGQSDVYLFRTPHLEKLSRDYRVPAWKVAMATAAAPTYFPVARQVDGIRLVDGGVWANNPTLVALAEAVGQLNQPMEDVLALNVGTMSGLKSFPKGLDRGGKKQWAKHAHPLILDASSLGVQKQAALLLPSGRYLRIDAVAPDTEVSLDDIRTADDLIAAARHYSRTVMPKVRDFTVHQPAEYLPCHRVGPEVDE